MRIPADTRNHVLAALVRGTAFRSQERFARAVNLEGCERYGLRLTYDHITVKRWLRGRVPQYPELVAAVISRVWGIPIPPEVIWPQLRDGGGLLPAHLQAWVVARTLEDLGAFIGGDMLSRREVLAGSVSVATGAALVDPLARWLDAEAVGVGARTEGGQRLGMAEVEQLERSTRYFAATDAEVGGSLSREAAVGQLKYAVDLARYGSYSDAVGNRLLAAIAGLAGLVGWMCHDCGMPGPAQRYMTYGLQAARESTDERAPLLAVRILGDLGQQMRWAGHHVTAARLLDLALGQLPLGRVRFNLTRAILTSNRAQALAPLGPSTLPEVRGATQLAVELHAQADEEERDALAGLPHRRIDVSEPELAAKAADCYLTLAREDRGLAAEAESGALLALHQIPAEYGRNRALAQIRLARVRFAMGEPEQGCVDGERAVELTERFASTMVTTRLRELLGDAKGYEGVAGVGEFRERVRVSTES
jgi:hypothetical protein